MISEPWQVDVRRQMPGTDNGNVFGVFYFQFEFSSRTYLTDSSFYFYLQT